MINKECPLCDKKKDQARYLVCSECYRLWTNQAGKTLATKGQIISILDWTKEETEKKLPTLRAGLSEKQTKYKVLQDEVNNEAFRKIIASLQGKKIPDEVFQVALIETKKKLWAEKGGNKLHFEFKSLEERLNFLESFCQELQKKTENEAAKPLPTEAEESL